MIKFILLFLFSLNSYAQISGGVQDVNILSGSVSLSGTSAVTQSGLWGVSLLTGANTIGSVNQAGTWTTGRTWTLNSATDSETVIQGTTPWLVGGIAAVGIAPTANPVSVSGTDAGNLKRHLRTDTSGRMEINTIQSLPTTADVSITGSLTNGTDTVVLNTSGEATSVFELTGTWVGTFIFEASNNNFTTFQPVAAVFLGGLATQSSSFSTNGFYAVLTAGFQKVRVRFSVFTSGTALVAANASVGNRILVALQGNPNNLQTLAAQGAAGAVAWKVDGSAVTQPISGTITAITNALPPGTNSIGTVQQATLTKGTQGTTGVTTQDLKDSGRSLKAYSATFTASITEALVTVTPITDGTAGTTATSFTVTSGKRLVLQSFCISTRNAGAAGQGVVVQLRMTSTGAVTVTSPLVGIVSAGTSLAVANISNLACNQLPEGFELSGTMQLGITQVGTATANNIVVLTGYEY